jgi:hypothetical protein
VIGVIVTFHYQDGFDAKRLTSAAESARASFEGRAGLRYKFWTVDEAAREAINFYVWASEEEAREFHTEGFIRLVTEIYGVTPSLRYVQVAQVVSNA